MICNNLERQAGWDTHFLSRSLSTLKFSLPEAFFLIILWLHLLWSSQKTVKWKTFHASNQMSYEVHHSKRKSLKQKSRKRRNMVTCIPQPDSAHYYLLIVVNQTDKYILFTLNSIIFLSLSAMMWLLPLKNEREGQVEVQQLGLWPKRGSFPLICVCHPGQKDSRGTICLYNLQT